MKLLVLQKALLDVAHGGHVVVAALVQPLHPLAHICPRSSKTVTVLKYEEAVIALLREARFKVIPAERDGTLANSRTCTICKSDIFRRLFRARTVVFAVARR